MAEQLVLEGADIYKSELSDDYILENSLAVEGFKHGVLTGEVFEDFGIVFHAASHYKIPSREIAISTVEEAAGLTTKSTIYNYTSEELLQRIKLASELLTNN